MKYYEVILQCQNCGKKQIHKILKGVSVEVANPKCKKCDLSKLKLYINDEKPETEIVVNNCNNEYAGWIS